jgi:hypothetical protein
MMAFWRRPDRPGDVIGRIGRPRSVTVRSRIVNAVERAFAQRNAFAAS